MFTEIVHKDKIMWYTPTDIGFIGVLLRGSVMYFHKYLN